MGGLCGTDLKIADGYLRPRFFPHILGHEIAGDVIDGKPASSRDETMLEKVAQNDSNVLIYPDIGCGSCAYCLGGEMNLCSDLKRPGFELPGGFAEYVSIPIRHLVPSPLGKEAAVLTDAGAAMLHAFRRGTIRPGTNVVVMGVGGLGTMAVQLAKLMGCRVIALDIDDRKLEFATELGADTSVNLQGSQVHEVKQRVERATDGKLAAAFVDLVGKNSSQELAMQLLARRGKLIQVGYSEANFGSIPLKSVVYREIEIIGSLAATARDLYDIVDLVKNGRIKLNVTKQYPLSEINSAFQDLRQNRILGRSVIVVSA